MIVEVNMIIKMVDKDEYNMKEIDKVDDGDK